METREVLLVDAFTREPMAGNPAGLVPTADGLSADQMAAIANELGASETAFVRDAADADVAFRYFTPAQEVDLCGHATIAARASSVTTSSMVVDAGSTSQARVRLSYRRTAIPSLASPQARSLKVSFGPTVSSRSCGPFP